MDRRYLPVKKVNTRVNNVSIRTNNINIKKVTMVRKRNLKGW